MTPLLATAAPPSPTASLAGARPPAAMAAPRVTLWADDRMAALAWMTALRHEGLEPTGSEQPRSDADAHLLLLHGGLALQLSRLREQRQLLPNQPLVVACSGLRDLDQVLALEIGADDVIDAAVSAPVVAARLRALWRRTRALPRDPWTPRELRFGALELCALQRKARWQGHELPLSEGEFELLWLLACQAGRPVSRHELLRRLRGIDDHPTDRSVDCRVYRIRARLAAQGVSGVRLRTVRNFGYALAQQGDPA